MVWLRVQGFAPSPHELERTDLDQCVDSAVAYAVAEGQVTDSKALQMQEL